MDAMIVSAVRTPIGALGGNLASLTAPQLAAESIRAALAHVPLEGGELDEVILGNVVGAGIGQNPARQAAVAAGIPFEVGAVTVNKVCGSGLKAVMLATQAIRLGEQQLVLAGGMESMSRAPYLALQARQGYRLGHGQLLDAVLHDGLCDAYAGQPMGIYGDVCATHCGFSRQDQDDFAVRSYQRARQAQAEGLFADEMIAIEVPIKGGHRLVDQDEEPARFDEAKLRKLKPAFQADGTVTAGNASSVNDGAAAVVVAAREACERRGWQPLARIVGAATFSREPQWFTLAPIGALQRLLDQVSWHSQDVDLYEINEAFSCVAMAAARELSIPAEKLNIHGGAVALGHPIGCSGARILVTLLHALRHHGGRRGVACLCVGGGEAVALAVELES